LPLSDHFAVSTDKRSGLSLANLGTIKIGGGNTMQKLSSLEHPQFVERCKHGTVAITVAPKLAHRVMRTRLMPIAYKSELLRSSELTEADFVIRYATESELFYDIMLELGVLSVQSAD
jgi:hypothetical protein